MFLSTVGRKERACTFSNVEIVLEGNEVLGFRSLESKVFNYDDAILGSFVGESRTTSEILEFLVELEGVVARTRTENAATTNEHRRTERASASAASTFLLFDFAS